MVDCIYSPHCTWKQCDYACPIFAEISYWMERCNIDIRNPVLKSDQAAINKGIEIREGNVSGHNSDVVDRVKKYIEENYADDELSLNRIASHVNFSPNHLSMVFSQQTGNTLIKYLTDFRINKAKEYLKCTNKKSSEISVLVGYKDPHYFSYLFKKTQGVTPTQFREG